MKVRPLERLACLTFALLLIAGSARAASCRITTVPTFVFPQYDVFGDAVNVMGTLVWSCNKVTTVRITFGPSLDGTLMPRHMIGGQTGTDKLAYNLYTDATYGIVWGDDSPGTQSYTNTADTDSVRIFGLIKKGEDVSPGAYTDTVVVTVNY